MELDIHKDFAVHGLFSRLEDTLPKGETSVEGLKKSLEMISTNGEITEKDQYDRKGDNLMYKELCNDATLILCIHARYMHSTYSSGKNGYRYEIGMYLNSSSYRHFGAGIIEKHHSRLFFYVGETIYFNETVISQVCDVIKQYYNKG